MELLQVSCNFSLTTVVPADLAGENLGSEWIPPQALDSCNFEDLGKLVLIDSIF